jgi:Ca2+:H+ antiporter
MKVNGPWWQPSLNWLLVFVLLSVVAEFAHVDPLWVFLASAAGIIPLAGWMGRATEELAHRVGAGVGGLLNATFGNAAELIIALVALRAGLHDVVKASLTGSIIGNILLVCGFSLLVGGIGRERQEFNRTAARSGATSLFLAAIALIMPAMYHAIEPFPSINAEQHLSVALAVILLVLYGLSLMFSLVTHRHLYLGDLGAHERAEPAWSLRWSIGVLLAATALIAVLSEFLVGSIEHTSHRLGLSELFVGVVVVAVIGNAAEHSTAVLAAAKDQMDLSMAISIGSSLQIALFVAPLLVLVSYLIGPPMDLVFTASEVTAVVLSVLIVYQIASDGESNWFEGAQLLGVYLILAIVFYFLPG